MTATFNRGLKGTGHGALPPMLEQYVRLRDEVDAQLPNALLLFQCGDFYETFGEDAERAARLMGLTLTHKTSKDFSTPMAGLPVRAADAHIEKLLAQGVRVAVADQLEEPGSGLMDRKITQLLTPGTVTEERLLSADENFLAAVATGDGYALALLDLSTGEFRCASFGTRAALYDDLSRWRAREVLLAPELGGNAALLADFQTRFPVMLSHTSFDEDAARGELLDVLGDLPASLSTPALIRACGAVLSYARGTQQGRLEMVRRISRYEPGAQLRLNDWALRALEVFHPQHQHSLAESTLIGALSETRSAGGRRRLRSWLRAPLRDAVSIEARQGGVDALLRAGDLRHGLRALLYRAHDLERLAARVATRRAGPREVAALARTLELLPDAAAPAGRSGRSAGQPAKPAGWPARRGGADPRGAGRRPAYPNRGRRADPRGLSRPPRRTARGSAGPPGLGRGTRTVRAAAQRHSEPEGRLQQRLRVLSGDQQRPLQPACPPIISRSPR